MRVVYKQNKLTCQEKTHFHISMLGMKNEMGVVYKQIKLIGWTCQVKTHFDVKCYESSLHTKWLVWQAK